MINVPELGMGGIHKSSDSEIEQVICKAADHGINFFDLCGSGSLRKAVGQGRRVSRLRSL